MRHALIGGSLNYVGIGLEKVDAKQTVVIRRLLRRGNTQPFVVGIKNLGSYEVSQRMSQKTESSTMFEAGSDPRPIDPERDYPRVANECATGKGRRGATPMSSRPPMRPTVGMTPIFFQGKSVEHALSERDDRLLRSRLAGVARVRAMRLFGSLNVDAGSSKGGPARRFLPEGGLLLEIVITADVAGF